MLVGGYWQWYCPLGIDDQLRLVEITVEEVCRKGRRGKQYWLQGYGSGYQSQRGGVGSGLKEPDRRSGQKVLDWKEVTPNRRGARPVKLMEPRME